MRYWNSSKLSKRTKSRISWRISQQVYLGNILAGKEINRAGKSQGINRAGEGIIRTSYGSRSSKMDF